MNAGLPGLGLGGMFFLLQALLAPAVELRRLVHGTSHARSRRTVARQFAFAVAMIAVVDACFRGLALLAPDATGGGAGAAAHGAEERLTALPLGTLALSVVVLGLVLALAEAGRLTVSDARGRSAWSAPLWVAWMGSGMVAALASWFAVLAPAPPWMWACVAVAGTTWAAGAAVRERGLPSAGERRHRERRGF